MRVLVIGGTRFIGPHVVRELVEQGHEVTVYHRGQNESSLPAVVRRIRSPLAGIPVVQFAPELFHPAPDVLIHMMAMGVDDTRAAIGAFRNVAQRAVWISSGDVYLAYGRFTGVEPGPVVPTPLAEDSPLRSLQYPYRAKASSSSALEWYYEKIQVEQLARQALELPATILRLPKVYGPGGNADFATVYGFRDHPQWRWTHGYVENVAHAIALAAVDPRAGGRTYNVGEEHTPAVAERLRDLPDRHSEAAPRGDANFDQDLVYDTAAIRAELGYREPVEYAEGIRRTLQGRTP